MKTVTMDFGTFSGNYQQMCERAQIEANHHNRTYGVWLDGLGGCHCGPTNTVGRVGSNPDIHVKEYYGPAYAGA